MKINLTIKEQIKVIRKHEKARARYRKALRQKTQIKFCNNFCNDFENDFYDDTANYSLGIEDLLEMF